jgi:hypothetical protein
MVKMFQKHKMNLVINKEKFGNIIIVLCMLYLSGNPFIRQRIETFTLASLLISLPIILTKPKSISNRLFVISIFFFLGFELFHSIIFEIDYSKTIIKIFLWYFFAFAIIVKLKDKFIDTYVKCMEIISIVSFIFFAICFIPGLNHTLYNFAANLFPLDVDYKSYSTPTLLVFTFDPTFFEGKALYPRNAGIFWEAGAFGSFLCIAYFLKLLKLKPKSINDLFDKQSLILLVAIFTTTSTTCFTALAIILITFSFSIKGFSKVIVIVLLLLSFNIAYNRLEFLKNKIELQLDSAAKTQNRFGSALLDLKDIKKRPLTGWTRKQEVLFENDEIAHRPNGITNLMRNYGLIYFTFYMVLLYLSLLKITTFYSYSKYFAVMGLIVILVLAFSQLLFDIPFIRGLIYIGFPYGIYLKYRASLKKNMSNDKIFAQSTNYR